MKPAVRFPPIMTQATRFPLSNCIMKLTLHSLFNSLSRERLEIVQGPDLRPHYGSGQIVCAETMKKVRSGHISRHIATRLVVPVREPD